MNKFLAVILSLLCVASVSLFAVSCDTNENGSNDPQVESNDSSAYVEEAESSEPVDDGKVTYTVTVVDWNDQPIEGIIIQFCDEENCKLPLMTDADGKVTVAYEESNYHVTITEASSLYTYLSEYYFDEGSTEMTIVLTESDE